MPPEVNHPITILIIGMDSETSKVIEETLLAYPEFQYIETQEHGRVGLESARQTQPDIILINSRTTDMNALELIRETHLASPESKIIAVPNTGDAIWIESALRAGATNILVNPIIPGEVPRMIRHVLKED